MTTAQKALQKAKAAYRETPPAELIDFEVPPGWFHTYQQAAWDSVARIVAVIAGWQSGKSVTGAPWLRREIQRCGPGDYGVGAPTFRLMDKKVLPEFLTYFKDYGTYNSTKFIFTFSKAGEEAFFGSLENRLEKWPLDADLPTKVFFGYAENPDSLESATYKAYWADECGQEAFKQESFEAIESRVMVQRGRILLTSRPYNFGWYKTEIHDRADRKVYDRVCKVESTSVPTIEGSDTPHIEVISFPSWANPRQDLEGLARQEAKMPEWKFRMKYGGQFTKPVGAIFDCFENKPELFSADHTQTSETNVCKRFPIPPDWPVLIGSDFGDNNTAAILSAAELYDVTAEDGKLTRTPTGRHFAFGAYKKAGRTNEEHAWALRCAACGYDLFQQFEAVYAHWQTNPDRSSRVQGSAPPPAIAAVLDRCHLRPRAVGGAKGEQGWRDAYQLGGLRIEAPPRPKISDAETIVKLGISCAYAGLKQRRFILFSDLDSMIDEGAGPISQLENYSYELDAEQEPTEKIKDKAKFHFADCYRYKAVVLFPAASTDFDKAISSLKALQSKAS